MSEQGTDVASRPAKAPEWRTTRRRFLHGTARGLAAGVAFGAASRWSGLAQAASPALHPAATTRMEIVWHPAHHYATYAAVISDLIKAHPGLSVTWNLLQWPDIRARLLAGFTAGNPPDVAESSPDWVAEFAKQGLLEPLTGYIARDGHSMGFPTDWDPETLVPAKVDGAYYAVPIHYTCALLFYNKTLLDRAGFPHPPTTWDEFLAVARATTRNGVWGYALASVEETALWPWFTQNGVRYYDPTTNRVGLDSPEAVEAVQFNVDMVHKYRVAPVPVLSSSYEEPEKLFVAGRAAMIYTGPWDLPPIQAAHPAFEWRIGPATRKKVQATWSSGAWLIIPRASRNKDLAWDFIKRITSLQTEVETTLQDSMTMPRVSWAHDPRIRNDALVAPFGQALATYAINYSKWIGFTGKTAQIDTLLQTAWEQAIYGQTSAAQALHALAQQANAILAHKIRRAAGG